MNATEDRVLYARLLSAIQEDGVTSATSDGVVIHGFGGRSLPWPMRLRITPESFGRHLRDSAAASSGAFPDIDPLEASWRLFLIHLDEAIQTAKPNETELVPGRYGVESLQADMTKAPLLREQHENREDQRRYDELVAHFADRGQVELELEAETIVIREIDEKHLDRPVRLRVPFRRFADHLRESGRPDEAYRRFVQEVDSMIAAGRTDMELRASGGVHIRE